MSTKQNKSPPTWIWQTDNRGFKELVPRNYQNDANVDPILFGSDDGVICDPDHMPLIATAPEMRDAIEHVLLVSEDCGDMNDIDWQMLREVLARAQGEE